ncbi:MAG: Cysteine desulfurase _ SufS [uncultured Solirubrobacteraceae bacterium]|uniref:cysteine desulfurase n=1 Tax=uncultured Solirubrobacteraceae bacterium TaxID=1162706 RepID=A0A6J4U4N1_9ACTN|nr:MAG: Cysteine desulfurase > SufS [uncultured Solirubrobacteraceae bacterium]
MATTAVAHDFPVLEREGLVYLDSAATAQKPRQVIDAMDDFLSHHNASVHRGVYPLMVEATERYEGARDRAARFVGSTAGETILTGNATQAINLVAQAWGRANLQQGDRVVITEMEHHSVIVPWHMICRERGAHLDVVGVDDEGQLLLEELDAHLAKGPKLVAITHVSNVLGTINPIEEIARRVHAAGALLLVDGSQAVPQIPVDVAALDADFYAWTGHKAYGPTGIGVLHGKREILEAMPPWIGGGHMINRVSFEEITFAGVPARFEAGTSPIVEGVGLGAAVDFLSGIGIDAVRAHERSVTAYAMERLQELPGLTIHGPQDPGARGALVSFHLDHAHPHDVAEILGRQGVCVRAGHHCAQPLMKRLGIGASTRASFAVHTTPDDVDRLVDALVEVHRIFGD